MSSEQQSGMTIEEMNQIIMSKSIERDDDEIRVLIGGTYRRASRKFIAEALERLKLAGPLEGDEETPNEKHVQNDMD